MIYAIGKALFLKKKILKLLVLYMRVCEYMDGVKFGYKKKVILFSRTE